MIDQVRIRAPNGRYVAPLVTGSFGSSNFTCSLLGGGFFFVLDLTLGCYSPVFFSLCMWRLVIIWYMFHLYPLTLILTNHAYLPLSSFIEWSTLHPPPHPPLTNHYTGIRNRFKQGNSKSSFQITHSSAWRSWFQEHPSKWSKRTLVHTTRRVGRWYESWFRFDWEDASWCWSGRGQETGGYESSGTAFGALADFDFSRFRWVFISRVWMSAGCFFCGLVMKKIEKTIGDSLFLWLFLHKQLCVDLLFFCRENPRFGVVGCED
jgi:hypothetical protein